MNLVVDFGSSQPGWQSWEILFNHGGDNLSYALFFWAFNENDRSYSLFSLFVKDTGVKVPGKPQQVFFSRSQIAGDFSVPARTRAGISPAGMSETIFDGVWPDGLSGCTWCLSFDCSSSGASVSQVFNFMKPLAFKSLEQFVGVDLTNA